METTEPFLQFGYYPGCSLEGLSREYDASLRAVCRALGIELREIEGWNCCGGSSAHAVNASLAEALAFRNLALASQGGDRLLVPCAACYHNLRRAQQGELRPRGTGVEDRQAPLSMGKAPHVGNRQSVAPALSSVDLSKPLESATPSPTAPSPQEPRAVRLLHVDELFLLPTVAERIRRQLRRPLSGLKAVAYYGCLVPRTIGRPGSAEAEDPRTMDRVLELLGVCVLSWSFKADCCGGSLGVTRPEIVRELVAELVNEAQKAGANCLVTACPMCFANLDGRQPEVVNKVPDRRPLPVFYLTEVAALALGLPDVYTWLARHCVDPRPLVDWLQAADPTPV